MLGGRKDRFTQADRRSVESDLSARMRFLIPLTASRLLLYLPETGISKHRRRFELKLASPWLEGHLCVAQRETPVADEIHMTKRRK